MQEQSDSLESSNKDEFESSDSPPPSLTSINKPTQPKEYTI